MYVSNLCVLIQESASLPPSGLEGPMLDLWNLVNADVDLVSKMQGECLKVSTCVLIQKGAHISYACTA